MKVKQGILIVMTLVSVCACSSSDPIVLEPTTAAEPAPTATSAEPTEVPICDPVRVGATEVLYSQDFSDPAQSWGTISDDVVQAQNLDGVYQFTGTWFSIIELEQKFPKDIVLEGEIEFQGDIDMASSSASQQQMEIEFRQSSRQTADGDVFYSFYITSDGFAGINKYIWYHDVDVFLTRHEPLIEPQKIAGFKPEGSNHFRLHAVGNSLSVYINDEFVFTIEDTFETNVLLFNISFFAKPSFLEMDIIPSEKPYDIRLDNICVYEP